MNKSYSEKHVLTAIVLLGAFLLRVFRIDQKPLWWDEGRNIFFATLDWRIAPNVAVRSGDVTPPIYRFLLGLWADILGYSPFCIRILSVFFAVVFLAILYRLVSDLYENNIAMISISIAAVSPTLVYYSQEAKGYALMLLAVTLSSLIYHRLYKTRFVLDIKHYLFLGLVNMVGAGSHYFYLLFIVIQVVLMLCWYVDRNQGYVTRYKLYKLMSLMFLQTIAISPVLIYGWSSLMTLVGGEPTSLSSLNLVSAVSLDDLARWGATTLETKTFFEVIKDYVFDFVREYFVGPIGSLTQAFVVMVLLGVPLLLGLQQQNLRPHNKNEFVLWLLIPIVLGGLFSFVFSYYYPRFILFVIPAIIILIAVGLSKMWLYYRRVVLVISVSVLSLWAHVFVNHYNDLGDIDEDWRDAIVYFSDKQQEGDLVLHTYDWMQGYIRSYGKIDREPDYFYVSGLDIRGLANKLVNREKVWLLDYKTTVYDPGSLYGSWMRERYAIADIRQFGNANLTMFVQPKVSKDKLNETEFINGIKLSWNEVETYVNPGEAIVVDVLLRSSEELVDNYQLFFHLLDSSGKLIVGNDTGPKNNLKPTTTWTPDEEIISAHALLIPKTVDFGQYGLQLGLYSTVSGERLMSTEGETIEIGYVIVEK